MTWLEYRQLPAWMWPTSAGSSETSTHSGSVAPAVQEREDTADHCGPAARARARTYGMNDDITVKNAV
eukprot:16448266-Heterocapsa_arctica.AAC.1